ncbi:hypothetical protein D3C79_741580 [compost metagenome]
MQAIVEGLLDQRVIRDLPFTDKVFQAGNLVREDCGDQVLAFHPLDLWGHFAPADKARQGQGDTGVPAPTNAEQWCIEQGLDQDGLGVIARQVAPHIIQAKAMAG